MGFLKRINQKKKKQVDLQQYPYQGTTVQFSREWVKRQIRLMMYLLDY